MPGEFYHSAGSLVEGSCSTFLAIAGILGALLFISALIMCWLAARLHSAIVGAVRRHSHIDQFVRETQAKYCNSTSMSSNGYTGRATTQ